MKFRGQWFLIKKCISYKDIILQKKNRTYQNVLLVMFIIKSTSFKIFEIRKGES